MNYDLLSAKPHTFEQYTVKRVVKPRKPRKSNRGMKVVREAIREVERTPAPATRENVKGLTKV